MTEKEYIKKLKKCLRFRVSGAEMSDILSDIEECFEAGVSEGKSEKEICLSLGSPESAAAELVPAADETVASSRLLPSVICTAAVSFFVLISAKSLFPLVYLLPVISPLVWLILERKQFTQSLHGSIDINILVSSVLVFLGGLSVKFFFINALKLGLNRSGNELVLPTYSLLSALLIAAAMVFLALSMIKAGQKILLVLPIAGIAGAAVPCFSKSLDFAHALSIGFGTLDAAEINVRYMHLVSDNCKNYFALVILCAAAVMLWAFISKDPAAMLSSSLTSGIMLQILCIYQTLRCVDPTDTFIDVPGLFSDNTPAVMGIAAAAVSLVIMLSARKGGRHYG